MTDAVNQKALMSAYARRWPVRFVVLVSSSFLGIVSLVNDLVFPLLHWTSESIAARVIGALLFGLAVRALILRNETPGSASRTVL
jgi:hypothetical protein